mmetsp:Transcript_9274/g.23002  ORF Transcript_9274/g.23002 Transcript_9274/m.23002 type:complete len:246 (-) Transcript_9274:3-740(-)
MLLLKELVGRLTKLLRLLLDRVPMHSILDLLQVPAGRIRHVVKDIVGLHRFRAPLLVPEYQVNPLVHVPVHIVRLIERLPVPDHEIDGRVSPRGQLHSVDRLAVLPGSEGQGLVRAEKFHGKVLHEKLWNQFLHIRRVAEHARPRLLHGVEHAIRRVELARLKPQEVPGGRPHQPIHHVARVAVVRSVQKRRIFWVALRHERKALLEHAQALFVQSAHGLAQIPEPQRCGRTDGQTDGRTDESVN